MRSFNSLIILSFPLTALTNSFNSKFHESSLSKKDILDLIEFANNFIDDEGNFRKENLFPDKIVANVKIFAAWLDGMLHLPPFDTKSCRPSIF